jgi:hypothetical protein
MLRLHSVRRLRPQQNCAQHDPACVGFFNQLDKQATPATHTAKWLTALE